MSSMAFDCLTKPPVYRPTASDDTSAMARPPTKTSTEGPTPGPSRAGTERSIVNGMVYDKNGDERDRMESIRRGSVVA